MASSNCDHAYAMLALQETERALDNVSQKNVSPFLRRF